MPKTVTQKILEAHAVAGSSDVGSLVRVSPDLVIVNDGSGPLVFSQLAEMGAAAPANYEKLMLVCDHMTPAPTLGAAEALRIMRRFAEEHRIDLFFDVGRGIEHALVAELGLAGHGDLVLGADSHTSTSGALGALGFGLGATDMASLIATDESWLIVPRVGRLTLSGTMPFGVTGKDVGLWVLDQLGTRGGLGLVFEFDGPGASTMSRDDRAAMSNMMAEAGTDSTIVTVPENDEPAWQMTADPGADYAWTRSIDLDSVEPLVALPGSPSTGAAISEVEGRHIDQVYIGNCANGSITDLQQAASILEHRRVASGTRCIIVPSSARVVEHAAREGWLEIFAAAGAVVQSPGCAACYGGHSGLVAAGEIVLANVNRNYHGRMGHRDARIYLANTLCCAAAAVAGEIIDPRRLLMTEPTEVLS